MKLIWPIVVAVCLGFAWAFTQLAKVYKFGPFLEEQDEFSDAPAVSVDHTDTLPEAPVEPVATTSPGVPPATPVTPPNPPTTMLDTFCRSIKKMENANPANNNPGNCRYYDGGYLPRYGVVRRSKGGFAMFATPELGWEYLQATVHHRAIAHPTWTIYDFFANYAPTSDGNNPKHYAEVVAKDCGVVPSTTLKALFG